MASIDITSQQNELLTELLENTLSDLRMEIAHTDNSTYKEILRTKKLMLNEILLKLKQP